MENKRIEKIEIWQGICSAQIQAEQETKTPDRETPIVVIIIILPYYPFNSPGFSVNMAGIGRDDVNGSPPQPDRTVVQARPQRKTKIEERGEEWEARNERLTRRQKEWSLPSDKGGWPIRRLETNPKISPVTQCCGAPAFRIRKGLKSGDLGRSR